MGIIDTVLVVDSLHVGHEYIPGTWRAVSILHSKVEDRNLIDMAVYYTEMPQTLRHPFLIFWSTIQATYRRFLPNGFVLEVDCHVCDRWISGWYKDHKWLLKHKIDNSVGLFANHPVLSE